MKLKEALKRIEELERKVRELEARPPQVLEYHFHTQYVYPVPQYPLLPVSPQPWLPAGPTWIANVGTSVSGSSAIVGQGSYS